MERKSFAADSAVQETTNNSVIRAFEEVGCGATSQKAILAKD